MARGRPKSDVAPCRFCKKEFKRSEHLKRHERIRAYPLPLALLFLHPKSITDTQEKPFVCQCGRSFSRQDLLSRHARLCHPPARVEEPTAANDAAIQTTLHKNGPDVQIQDLENLIPAPQTDIGDSPAYNKVVVQTQNENALSSETHAPADTFDIGGSHDQTCLGFGLPSELDPWNTEVFLFNDVVPSHFLNTDISLCNLFQQFPSQDQPAMQADFIPAIGSVGCTLPPEVQPMMPVEQPASEDPPLPPRFPSTDDQLHNTNLDAESDTVACPWSVSAAAYKHISENATRNKSILTDFKLPSRFTLIRYLEGYFDGFHDHLPIIHTATFDPQNIELELFLALTACGAFYRFEHEKGYQLYDAARCLVDRSFHNRRRLTMGGMTVGSPASGRNVYSPSKASHASQSADFSDHHTQDSHTSLQRAQTLIILIAMSAWGEQALIQDSLAMGSQLALLVREIGIGQPDDTTDMNLSWRSWVMHQQRRRTSLGAYIIFNLHSIAFNVPPLILSQEVALCLPSCEAEWKVKSQAGWERYRRVSSFREHAFTITLDRLLQGRSVSDHFGISAFGNYVLIHGLVQKVNLERQTASCLAQDGSLISPQLLKQMETALRSWQSSWEAAYESTLDPCSPKGPLGFNATALLRLAHIRLHANLGPCRDLISGNSARIQQIFTSTDAICVARSTSLDRAVLQCIHALSIPVRVGIPYLSRTQALHWSIQHSLCSLECAFLLSRWLQEIARAVSDGGMASLREDEQKLLAMVTSLIQETHLQETLKYREDLPARINRLAASTTRLWAEVSSASHAFEIVHRIGASLSIVADILENRLPPSLLPSVLI
ncbi:uncharacterized protein N7515_000692 [Penicillium bovifimosum]|uniref:C2H2-type domain-containing protein n=1 Tax=Penicillium bovifimosum TaxID=126998 RepID=A0A9W9HG83_9EURO|nr:uncharacterized protein N7515_000692 [Penicillium bovifimosum]KAJ5146128.1 hypothetical protein N7515_000692 [Penicillium bovifimosum]